MIAGPASRSRIAPEYVSVLADRDLPVERRHFAQMNQLAETASLDCGREVVVALGADEVVNRHRYRPG
jgi:hypothetical protein